MRSYQPGGRFDADYETDAILDGIEADLTVPVGSTVDWWIYDPTSTEIDPIYDVGSESHGRRWKGPYKLPVIRTVINQGNVPQDNRGFYNSDTIHFTIDATDVNAIDPTVLGNPDIQNRGRMVWLGEVFRPYGVQQAGLVANRFTLLLVDAIQVMPEEMVNDPQFAAYASGVPDMFDQ